MTSSDGTCMTVRQEKDILRLDHYQYLLFWIAVAVKGGMIQRD